MRRIKRALSVTKAPKIEELADIHEHHETEGYTQNGMADDRHSQANNNQIGNGEFSSVCILSTKQCNRI